MDKSSTKQTKLPEEEVDKLMHCQNTLMAAYHNRHKPAAARIFWDAVRCLKDCNPDWTQELCEGYIYSEWARYLAMEYTLNHPAPDIKPTTNKTADA